ncbi:MAG: hypothetical protein A2X46_05180 [Lentisphaerae bacterium GWF2_57_35]|nr:MAG: hypothetical protein A2X46_05180 [Lentisphaerae bacterium GWF2_57_35]
MIRGGTEGQCARVLLELHRRGFVQRTAVFQRTGVFVIPVEQVCGSVKEIRIRRLIQWRTLHEVLRLVSFIRRASIDLVHAWDADAAIFGAIAAKWAGRPYITSRRDMGQIYAPRKLQLMHWADSRSASVVVNAEAIRSKLLQDGLSAERITCIPNFFDLEEFDTQAEKPFSQADKLPAGLKLVVVARLDREKDVASIIAALPDVLSKRPDASLVIAGDGPERIRLEQKTVQMGLARSVVFLGEVMDIPALLKQCHVGVLTPQANEGLSNSIMEYMAAGLPAVVTDCGGNRELIKHGVTGSVVSVGDTQLLAQSISRWLEKRDSGFFDDWKSRGILQDRHAPSCVGDQFAALYSRVLGAV